MQLTLGVNSIPGMSLNGQFLLEINTFSSARQIRTFVVDTQTVNGRTVFGGFQRVANGALVVANQTLNVVAGFRLEMYGSLHVLNVLEITGHVVLTVSASELALLVNGRATLDPFGELTIVDSGFRITSQGRRRPLRDRARRRLRRRRSASASRRAPSSSSTRPARPRRSAARRSRPDSSSASTARSTSSGSPAAAGFAEIRIASNAFEMSFGVAFDLAGLKFMASGVAGVYDDGFVMAVSVSASADAFVFSLAASGTLRINTVGVTAQRRRPRLQAAADRIGHAAEAVQLRRRVHGRGRQDQRRPTPATRPATGTSTRTPP